jgi:hypothetical protein
MSQIDLERLICAGAIDKQFGELVLRDPLRAAEGYRGERFNLSVEEKALIARILANDYPTLVQAVAAWILGQRFPHLAPGEIRIAQSDLVELDA